MASQPSVWTILTFECADNVDEFAATFADVLATPSWYVDFEFDGWKAPQ